MNRHARASGLLPRQIVERADPHRQLDAMPRGDRLSAQRKGKRGQRGYHDNHNNYSSGLLNVSPDLDLGDINLLNGNSILSGNRTSIGNGILGGALIGILGGNSYTSKHSVKKSKRGRGRR